MKNKMVSSEILASEKVKRRIHSFQKRVIVLFSGFSLLFTLLYLRIGFLSCSGELAAAARQQRLYTLPISESRREIYDCRLSRLTDTFMETRYAVIPRTDNLLPVLRALPQERQESVRGLFQSGRPFLLSGAEEIHAPGVIPFSVPIRTAVPQLAPHIIGYTDNSGHGICGIEQSWDKFLSASPSVTEIVFELNALGSPISGFPPKIRQQTPSPSGVVLTIDSNIQKVVENAGSKGLKKGAVVVMEPYTGKIRAAASFPSYTMNSLSESIKDTQNTPMINRVLLPFSVGSTFKAVTAAAALEKGIPIDTVQECTGQIDVRGQIIRCHKRSGHGELDMIEAMMKSCNPYFIGLGLKTGGLALREMTTRFGFGERIPLSENIAGASGTIPSESQLINPAAVANLSFGQGELTATPLQITRMMAAACNGGLLVQPRLIEGITMDGAVIQEEKAVPARRILSPEIAAQLQSILIHCVMVEEGQNSFPGIVSAGGKTATAQTGRFDENGKEYEHGWFSGFFPASAPKYVITVLSEDSGFGNGTAAPVFAEIARILAEQRW